MIHFHKLKENKNIYIINWIGCNKTTSSKQPKNHIYAFHMHHHHRYSVHVVPILCRNMSIWCLHMCVLLNDINSLWDRTLLLFWSLLLLFSLYWMYIYTRRFISFQSNSFYIHKPKKIHFNILNSFWWKLRKKHIKKQRQQKKNYTKKKTSFTLNKLLLDWY